ncbi:uncharacterized protein LOC128952269 [Oppia nitens]|uniref:uncharacterized protein LOC128952269 n=1 Tax=Oppia nitens TaxID=1686743 RepID=UPI0023DAA771|nr:uncharacterized protein LOC128952269 [Oppia nitens]
MAPKIAKSTLKDVSVSSINEVISTLTTIANDIESNISESGNIKTNIKESILNSANQIRTITAYLQTKPISTSSNNTFESTLTSLMENQSLMMKEIQSLKNSTKTYASATAKYLTAPKTTKPEEPQKPKYSSIIKSNNENDKHEEVWKKFTTNIHPKVLKCGIANKTRLSNNTIRLDFESTEDRDKVINEVNKTKVLSSEPARKRNPLIQLKGVLKETPKDDIIDAIVKQNPQIESSIKLDDQSTHLKIRFERKNRSISLINYVLEVSPKVYSSIKDINRLNLHHQRVYFEDFSPLVQCFKCLGFGHTSAKCTSTTDTCGHCAESHKRKECPHLTNKNKINESPKQSTMDTNAKQLKLKVLQCNLQRKRTTLNELIQNHKDNYDIALVQEPYVSNIGEIRCPKSIEVIQQKSDTDVKSAILIFNPNIKYLIQSKYSNSNITTIDILLKTYSIRLCSIYNPPHTDISSKLSTLSEIKKTSKYLIIGGDVNAKHLSWTKVLNNDDNGNKIENFLIINDMEVLNVGNVPTFQTTRGENLLQSIIDITASTLNLSTKIINWQVNPKLISSSDHNAICFDILLDECIEKYNTSTHKFRTKYADWEQFKLRCLKYSQIYNINDHRIEMINNLSTLDNFISDLTTTIHKACNDSIPVRKHNKVLCHWWTEELDVLKDKLLKSKHRLQNAIGKPPKNAVDEYSNLQVEYTQLIKKHSLQSWKEYISKQNKDDVWSNIFRVIKDAPNKQLKSTFKIDGTYTTNAKDSAETLLNYFYPDDTPQNDTLEQQILRTSSEDDYNTQPNDSPIKYEEILEVLHNMNPKKAPGLDNLTSDIIEQFTTTFPNIVTKLLNVCYTLNLFPTYWKTAYVKIIPKPGKENYNELSSHRPIGLLPVFGKVLEGVIIRRVQWDLHKRGQLSNKQYGFTPQTSTVDAISNALNIIKYAKSKKEYVMAISLDIKAAFDNAWWPAVINGLKTKNTPKNTLDLIKHYFKDRKVLLNYGNNTATKVLTKGCIQGSIGGPTFWNIIIDDLLSKSLPPNAHMQAFADDVLLITHHKDKHRLKNITEEVLQEIIDWGKKVKLTFGSEKTKLISFNQRQQNIPILMNNKVLEYENHIKVLGIIIDKDLKFNKHIEYAINKCSKIYRSLLRVAAPTWGLDSEIIRIIYLRAIEPAITYGCSTWIDGLKLKYAKKKLLAFQRSIAIRICKGFHTLSFTTAFALANVIPLDLKIKEIAEIENAKRNSTSEYMDFKLQHKVKFTLLKHPSQRTSISFNDTSTPTTTTQPNEIKIYTDGSKLDGKVGCAFQVYEQSTPKYFEKHKLGDNCSVFQSELCAIEKALEYSKRRKIKYIKLYSDSRSALQSLKNRSTSNQQIYNIQILVNTLKQQLKEVRFYWTKAHIGTDGNETADILAKNATLSHKAPILTDMPLSTLKKNIREKTIYEWNQQYISSTTGSTLKTHFPSIHDVFKLHNKTGTTFEMTQVLSGHGYHLEYLKKFNITTSDACPCDEHSTQSLDHLILITPVKVLAKMSYEPNLSASSSDDSEYSLITVESNEVLPRTPDYSSTPPTQSPTVTSSPVKKKQKIDKGKSLKVRSPPRNVATQTPQPRTPTPPPNDIPMFKRIEYSVKKTYDAEYAKTVTDTLAKRDQKREEKIEMLKQEIRARDEIIRAYQSVPSLEEVRKKYFKEKPPTGKPIVSNTKKVVPNTSASNTSKTQGSTSKSAAKSGKKPKRCSAYVKVDNIRELCPFIDKQGNISKHWSQFHQKIMPDDGRGWAYAEDLTEEKLAKLEARYEELKVLRKQNALK